MCMQKIVMLTLFVVPVVYCGFKELKMNLGLPDRHFDTTDANIVLQSEKGVASHPNED